MPSYTPSLTLCTPSTILALTGLPATGNYTLYVVAGAAQRGTIHLQIQGTGPTVSATVDGPAVPVTIPDAAPGQRVAITFTGTAGQGITMASSTSTIRCATEGYSLIGPQGQVVVPSYAPTLDLCNPSTFLVPTGLPTTGTYTFYFVPDVTQRGTVSIQALTYGNT